MNFTRVVNCRNESYRNAWVSEKITSLAYQSDGKELLDVGAGQSPYRRVAECAGWKYRSHDFGEYLPSDGLPGLQNESWRYPAHDLNCDILDIPDFVHAHLVLCTEVLEHVPDPVSAFRRLAEITVPGGFIVVTVPFLSLMHQAPYWFSSGLSPFWFSYWAPRFEIMPLVVEVQGDYIDLMAQEVARVLDTRPRVRGLSRIGSFAVRNLRRFTLKGVLESGGLGTLFVGRKMGESQSA